ncbi:hypothetical protein JCM6882_005993 [Rhodosporidiobolus microsporus]
MLHRLLLLVGVLVWVSRAAVLSSAPAETYREALRLTPFPDGKVLSQFNFTLEGHWDPEGSAVGDNSVAHHHTLLPRLLTSLIRQHRVTSFHLTLSSGRWASTWPLHLPASLPASGIELTAWLELLEGETDAEEKKRWDAFTGAVGGLFCAGIGSESVAPVTDSPTWGFEFEGEGDEQEHRLYHAALPRLAAACTESLTPFSSLLTCSSHAGLSSLLNPHRLFDGEWTHIGVKVVHEEESERARVELEVGSVQDPVRRDRLKGQLGRREFSLASLYDRTLTTTCPVATSSQIELVVPSHSPNPFSIEPDLAREIKSVEGREVAVWDVKSALEQAALDVRVTWPGENPFRYPHPSKLPTPPLTTRRLLSGVGQERGRIGVEVVNNLDREAEVVWVESWPWWVRGFISTLETMVDGNKSSEVVAELDYKPSIARVRPTTLQALLRLPPHSTTQLTLAYESATLWYTEYPSDANRGFSVPGAQLILLSPPPPSDAASPPLRPRQVGFLRSRVPLLRLHTPTTLLSLPLPDFSMPYNVIILTSTIVALFFGSIVNGLVRRWLCVDLTAGGGGGKVHLLVHLPISSTFPVPSIASPTPSSGACTPPFPSSPFPSVSHPSLISPPASLSPLSLSPAHTPMSSLSYAGVPSTRWSSSLGLGEPELELDYGEDDLLVVPSSSGFDEEPFGSECDAKGAAGRSSCEPVERDCREQDAASASPEYSPQLDEAEFAMDVDHDDHDGLSLTVEQVEEGELVEEEPAGEAVHRTASLSSAFPPLDSYGHLPPPPSSRPVNQKKSASSSAQGGKRPCVWRDGKKVRPGPYDRYKQEVAFNRAPPSGLRAWDDEPIPALASSPFQQQQQHRPSGLPAYPRQPSLTFSSSNAAGPGSSFRPRGGAAAANVYPSPPPSSSERMSSFDQHGPLACSPPPLMAMGMPAPSEPAAMRRRPPPTFPHAGSPPLGQCDSGEGSHGASPAARAAGSLPFSASSDFNPGVGVGSGLPFPLATAAMNPAVATVALQMGLQLLASAVNANAQMQQHQQQMGMGMMGVHHQQQQQHPQLPPFQQQQQQPGRQNGPGGQGARGGRVGGGMGSGRRGWQQGQGQQGRGSFPY